MTNESTFQILTAVLVVLANVSLWKTRGASRLKTDWPTMKKNGKDTLVLLLISLGWAITLVAFWTSLSFLEKFALPIHPLVRWIGFPIGLGAIHFLSKADKALGKNLSLSPEIKQNHSLVTHGPYKYVRHPIYLAGLGFALSISILGANYLMATCWLGGIILLCLVRIPREEKMLKENFGSDFEAYAEKTGKLFPRFYPISKSGV